MGGVRRFEFKKLMKIHQEYLIGLKSIQSFHQHLQMIKRIYRKYSLLYAFGINEVEFQTTWSCVFYNRKLYKSCLLNSTIQYFIFQTIFSSFNDIRICKYFFYVCTISGVFSFYAQIGYLIQCQKLMFEFDSSRDKTVPGE